MQRPPTRRTFLKHSALAGVGYWVAAGTARAQSDSPNEKLNIGIIGVAGRGGGNMRSVSKENIVALCDIDEKRLAGAVQAHPKAP